MHIAGCDLIMSLLEKYSYLFEINGQFNPEAFREFLKADDMHNNMYIGIVYDFNDYQEYR